MRTKQKEAKAKGEAEPGANSLKDLNRCTFVFDSPAVLALAVLLLKNKVEALKGTVERVSNLFFPNVNPENDSDGKVKANPNPNFNPDPNPNLIPNPNPDPNPNPI